MHKRWIAVLLPSCLMACVLGACHAGPRIEAAAREVRAEQEAEQQADEPSAEAGHGTPTPD